MIYLDNAATTYPKPARVMEGLTEALRRGLGNPGRSGHELARAAESAISDCRHRLNRLVGGEGPERVVLTLNGTDALNIAIKGLVSVGDHVVTGMLEHNSVRRPLAGLAARGVKVTTIMPDADGYYRAAEVAKAITKETKLVALTHASNVLGTVQPVEEIGRVCRSAGVVFLVDAAQTAGCWPIDVRAMEVDLLAAPGHKGLFGPMGTGFLYVRPGVALSPFREGGTGHDSGLVLQPETMPERLEAGTPNVLGIVGLGLGLAFVEEIGGARAIQEREAQWTERLYGELAAIAGVEIVSRGREGERVAVASFLVSGYAPQEVTSILEGSFGICARGGLHCAPGAHEFLGTHPDGATRVSGSALSTEEEITALADALRGLLG